MRIETIGGAGCKEGTQDVGWMEHRTQTDGGTENATHTHTHTQTHTHTHTHTHMQQIKREKERQRGRESHKRWIGKNLHRVFVQQNQEEQEMFEAAEDPQI